MDERMDTAMSQDQQPTLTTRQGRPVDDNQNTKTVGQRGPATLENYQFLEKISHFDRERVPERVVHARGTVAHGYFEAYGTVGDQPIGALTRAKLLQQQGKRTPVLVRFSTVIHSKDSPETLRDPRGFAVKFYTEDGNWDLVGNNLGVFFIRDAIKFPDFIHSQKPDPVSFEASVAQRAFDFFSQSPEAMQMVMLVFSPRGIPAGYRFMQGFGVNTYKWVNAEGATRLVKYHWLPKQGVKSWSAEDAAAMQAQELGCHTKDLFAAIERGEHPEWELCVQLMSDEDHPELEFDPLDDTKVWPEDAFPLQPIGRMVLDRNVSNFFAENEQIAFGTGVLVDGLDFSDDKMLVGRTFSYSDTQRHRVGTNYLQLPVNQAKNAKVSSNQRDGQMAYVVDDSGTDPSVNYEPSMLAGLREAEEPAHQDQGPTISGRLTRQRIPRTNDYQQPGERYLLSEPWERDDLVANLVDALSQCDRRIQERMVWHFFMCEDELGQRVGEGLGIGADEVRELPPLSSQTLSQDEQQRLENLGHNGPRDVEGKVMTHCVPNERVAASEGETVSVAAR